MDDGWSEVITHEGRLDEMIGVGEYDDTLCSVDFKDIMDNERSYDVVGNIISDDPIVEKRSDIDINDDKSE